MKRVLILVFCFHILFIGRLFSQNSYLLGYEIPIQSLGFSSGCLELKSRNTVTIDIIYHGTPKSILTISFRDSSGQMLWHRSIRGDFSLMVPMLENFKGELYFFGIINTSGCILKTDAMGNMLWCRSYGLSSAFWRGIVCENENMLICGSYSDENANIDTGGFLIKIDPNGEIIWQKSIGHSMKSDGYGSYFYDLKNTKDGGYLLTGNKSPKFGCDFSVGPFIVKTDGSGNVKWAKIFGCARTFAIEALSDGNFLSTGFDTNKKLIYINSIAADGTLNWAKKYDIKDVDEIGLIPAYLIDKFDHYLLFANGYHSIHIFDLKIDGEINWINTLSSGKSVLFENLSMAYDGGYFISGAGEDSIVDYKAKAFNFIMKTDINGEIPCLFTKDYNPPIEVTDYVPQIESGALEKDLTITPVEIILKDTTIEISQQIICYTTATQEVKEKAISVQLYPNPANNELNITVDKTTLPTGTKLSIDIVDGLGCTLLSQKLDWDGQAIINTSELPPGWYAAVVNGDGHKLLAEKFVVMRFN